MTSEKEKGEEEEEEEEEEMNVGGVEMRAVEVAEAGRTVHLPSPKNGTDTVVLRPASLDEVSL